MNPEKPEPNPDLSDLSRQPSETFADIAAEPQKGQLSGKTVYVLDAHGILYQVFHAFRDFLTSPQGEPVGAVFGFIRDIISLLKKGHPDYIFCAFDKPGPTFRHRLYPDYKANRSEMPDDLRLQIGAIPGVLSAFGIQGIGLEGFEADDILATVAAQTEKFGGCCVLVTADKDARQLISNNVSLFNLRKNQFYNAESLKNDWGILPRQVVDFQTMVGDATDNVQGIPLIGPKLAGQLLNQFDSLENIFANVDSISGAKRKENIKNSRLITDLSRQLVELKKDVPIEIDWKNSQYIGVDPNRLKALFRYYGFRSLLPKVDELVELFGSIQTQWTPETLVSKGPDYWINRQGKSVSNFIDPQSTAAEMPSQSEYILPEITEESEPSSLPPDCSQSDKQNKQNLDNRALDNQNLDKRDLSEPLSSDLDSASKKHSSEQISSRSSLPEKPIQKTFFDLFQHSLKDNSDNSPSPSFGPKADNSPNHSDTPNTNHQTDKNPIKNSKILMGINQNSSVKNGDKNSNESIKQEILYPFSESVFSDKVSLPDRLSAWKNLSVSSKEQAVPESNVFENRHSESKHPELDFPTADFSAVDFSAVINPVSPEKKPDFILIDTLEKFNGFLDELKSVSCFSFDTETFDIQEPGRIRPRFAKPVGMSFCWSDDRSFYLALRAPLGYAFLPNDIVFSALKPILENPGIAKIGQNIKYDAIVLRNVGIDLQGIQFDTMIADYLLHSGDQNHNLDDLSERYLNYTKIKTKDLLGTGKKQKTMDMLPTDLLSDYAAEDAWSVWKLRPLLQAELLKKPGLERLLTDLELPMLSALIEIESTGICINPEHFRKLSIIFYDKIQKLEQEIIELAGTSFNLNSPKQLQKILFDDLKLPVIKKTKTGASTDVEVLEELAQIHPLPAKLIEHRQAVKLYGTYILPIPEERHPETGRIHASFNQVVTATGRLSSSDPNLQNIPVRTQEGKDIRAGFVPDASKGFDVILSCDYSQIELRMLAHLTQDEHLCQAFRNGMDIHQHVAGRIFHVPEEAVTPDMRRKAKAVNFGLIYGQTSFGLSKTLGILRDEAADYIQSFFEEYPSISDFFDRVLDDCRAKGYVQTILGRRRVIAGVRGARYGQQMNMPERTAINTVIQGSAADLMKLAMVRVFRRLYLPDSIRSDSIRPNLSNLSLNNPNLNNFNLNNPSLSNPDLSNPDLSNPDLSNPDLSNPDLSNPDLNNPDLSSPNLDSSDLNSSDLNSSDLNSSDLNSSDLNSSDFLPSRLAVCNLTSCSSALAPSRANLLLQIHDELVFETSQKDVDALKQLVIEEMELGQPLSIPLKVDAEIGSTWGDV